VTPSSGQTDLLERAQRRFARRQRSVRRRSWLRWLVGTVVVLLLGGMVWLVLFSSVLAVSSVEVRGNRTVPQATVLRSAAVPTGTPLARVDTGAIADRVRQITAVADVRVSRSWPDRVVLTVTERAAVVAVTIGERYELVDAAGVSFRITDRRPDGLPQAKVGGPRREVTLRSVVAVSAALPDQLRGRVRLISAASPDSISLDLDSGVKVVWGSAERSGRKAEVLLALMRRPAEVYDVSAPDLPVTQGEKR
jgi:cell division protein FtsQ